MPEYTVRQGDTTASIAYEAGFLWETIWNHGNNAELKRQRGNPNVLYPGDVLFVPELQPKEEAGATEQRHRFRRRGVPEKLRIRLLDENDEPRSGLPYVLEIDGGLFEGTTNDEGVIEHPISPAARGGRLTVGESGEERYRLNLGHLDPIQEITGVQGRLRNLGMYLGEVNGEMTPETVEAIREFQRHRNLEENGALDDETRRQLADLHIS